MAHTPQNIKRISLTTSLLAVVVGIVAKLSLTKGDLLPGLDGAFYWVQVRSVLENLSLAFSDLPLVFWVQAAIAWVVGDVPLGVRISDAVLPALSAIPIYLIARRFKNPFLPAIAILVVLLHPIQLYFFTGDFIKNEATIPAVFFMALVLVNWEHQSKKLSVIYSIILFVITALSHFGTALLAFILIVLWGLLQMRRSGRKFWLKGLALSCVAFVGLLTSLAVIVPNRYERLVEFLTTPSAAFVRPVIDGIIHGYANSIITFTIITSQIAVVVLAIISWRSRSNFSFSDMSLVISSLIATFVLSSPFISMEWADRLTGLSFVPLSIAAILIFGNADKNLYKAPVTVLAALTFLSSMTFTSYEMKIVFSDEKYSDFKQLVQQVDIPENSVIVARHGVQYLSAWHFETDVVLESYFETADLSSYSAVFILVENRTSEKKEDALNPPSDSNDDKTKPSMPSGDKAPDNGGKEINPQELTGQTVFHTWINPIGRKWIRS
jgi:hypothetical protein